MMKKWKGIWIGVLALSIIFFTGCTSKATKAMAKAELGQKYLTELNYTEAVASFTEAIGLDPDSITGYMGRAQAYAGLEQYEEAKADYTTAIEKTTYRPYYQTLAYMGRAEVLTAMGDGAAAKADYDLALEAVKRIDLSSADAAFRQAVQNMIESITQASAKLDQTENGMGENADSFQQIMDSIAVPDAYAACKRYVLVNDYDGDGKQEAFGFLGIRNDEYQTWTSVKLYYLKSDGSVEEIALNGDVMGGPAEVSGSDQMDFSGSFITLGDKTFLDFEIGYQASEPTTVLFGVNDGNYTSTSVYGYFPEKVDENHLATMDLDYRVVYKEENGVFTEIMRMPGEEYEDQFASKEEYLNSMLTEEQLRAQAGDLNVPADLNVRYIQSARTYWDAGQCWDIYVMVCVGRKVVASCSIDPASGEWTRNIQMYDPNSTWEIGF